MPKQFGGSTSQFLARVGTFDGRDWKILPVTEAEVPEDSLRCVVDGVTFFAPRRDVARSVRLAPGQPLHPPLPEDLNKSLGELAHAFNDYLGWTASEWGTYLRAQPCPWRDLARWTYLLYLTATVPPSLPVEQTRRLLVKRFVGVFYGAAKPGDEAAARARKLLDDFDTALVLPLGTSDLRARMRPARSYPRWVNLDELLDDRGNVNLVSPFDPVDLLAAAPLVVAVETDTNAPLALFAPRSEGEGYEALGRDEFPPQYAEPSQFPEDTVFVRVDSLEDVSRLGDLVQAAKGYVASKRLELHGGQFLPIAAYRLEE